MDRPSVIVAGKEATVSPRVVRRVERVRRVGRAIKGNVEEDASGSGRSSGRARRAVRPKQAVEHDYSVAEKEPETRGKETVCRS